MKDTLDRTDLDDNTKVLLYQQALQRYLQFDRARKQEPISVTMSNPKGYYDMTEDVTKTTTVTPVNQPDTGAEIIEGVPKTYKRKAQLLLEKIKKNDAMNWNDKGELKIGEDVVKGSNITDLINDVLHARKGFDPLGWQQFVRGLASMNVPETLVGNVSRRTIVQRHKQNLMTPNEKRVLPVLPTATSKSNRKRVTRAYSRHRPKKQLLWEFL